MLRDRCDMKVALCRRGSTCNRRRSWRNDNRRFGMTFGDGIVHRIATIRAVRCHRSNVCVDLIEQVRYFGDITHIIECQFDREDFMRASVHAEVKLASPPVRPDTVLLIEPFAFAINLQARAVDQEMQWLSAVNVLWQYCLAAGPTAQRRMIWYGNGDAQHVGD